LSRIEKLFQVGTGVSISMFAILMVPFCPSYHALLLSGVMLGAGVGMSIPALSNLSVGIGKRSGMGTWMGLFYAAVSIGTVVAPIVAGIIMDHFGIDAVFYIVALVAFFGTLLSAFYIYRRMKGKMVG